MRRPDSLYLACKPAEQQLKQRAHAQVCPLSRDMEILRAEIHSPDTVQWSSSEELEDATLVPGEEEAGDVWRMAVDGAGPQPRAHRRYVNT